MTTDATCTVRDAFGVCGKPAVYTFTGSRGETFGECEEHYDPKWHEACERTMGAIDSGPAVGDPVTVHRHGKSYTGRVHHVTRTGKVYAEVTYGNGATRIVPVER